jgi:AcrR family transcriptional regulator
MTSSSPNSQDHDADPTAAGSDRPQRADARRNRDALVDAAEAVFSEQGAGASLEAIARRAGVGIGTLYRHFPTREDLIAQVICTGNDAIIARAHDLLTADAPLAALTSWLEALIRQSATFRGLTQALAAGYAGNNDSQQLCMACDVIMTAGGALVVRAQEAGEIRRDVPTADVILSANASAWLAEQTGDSAAALRHLHLVLAGLRTPPAPGDGLSPPPPRSAPATPGAPADRRSAPRSSAPARPARAPSGEAPRPRAPARRSPRPAKTRRRSPAPRA